MTAESIKRGKQTKPSKEKIKDLVINKGLTQEEAGKLVGVSRQRITQIIQEAKNDPEVSLFAANKDKVLEGLQRKLINLASDDLLKTMLSKRGFTDVAILQDKIQLLRGEATSIQAVDIRGLIGCVIKSQETGKVEGEVIDIEESNPE